jgi:hypothetical protein
LAELVDPVVVGIAGGHGGAPPCAPGAVLVALVVDLLLAVEPVDPPADTDAPEALGRVEVGTLRGSQPSAIEQVGFTGLVVKLLAPPFCCVWVAGVPVEGTAATAAGFCMV